MKLLAKVPRALEGVMWRLSGSIVRMPLLFLVMPLVLTMLSMVGLVIHKDAVSVSDPFSWLLPERDSSSGRAPQFNSSQDRFNAIDSVSPADFAVILVGGEGQNALGHAFMEKYLDLKHKFEDISVSNDNNIYWFSTMCRYAAEFCEIDVVRSIVQSGKNTRITYPEFWDPILNQTFYMGNTFGGVKLNAAGDLVFAKSLLMQFKLKEHLSSSEFGSVIQKWDTKFQDIARNEALNGERLSRWSYAAFRSSTETLSVHHLQCLAVAIAVTAVLCLVFHLSASVYSSRPWLALVSVACTLAPPAVAFVLAVAIKVQMVAGLFPAYFFVAGYSSYFLFDFLSGWRKFRDLGGVVQKFRFWFGNDTPIFLFFLGSAALSLACSSFLCRIPLVKWFCYQSLFTLAALGLCALLLYCCALYLTGKREAGGFPWFLCWRQVKDRTSESIVLPGDKKSVFQLQRKLYANSLDWSRCTGAFASQPGWRYLCLLFFCLYLVFAAWGCSTLRVGLAETDMIDGDSTAAQFLTDINNLYPGRSSYLELVFQGPLQYHKSHVYAAIEALLKSIESDGFGARVVSWLRDFKRFEVESVYYIGDDTFVPVLKAAFLTDPRYEHYAADVAVDAATGKVSQSRMYVQLQEQSKQATLALIRRIEHIAEHSNLHIEVNAPGLFLLPHDIRIADESTLLLLMFILMTSLLAVFVFAHVLAFLYFLIMLGSIAVGCIGFLAFWSVKLNAFTLIVHVSAQVYASALLHASCQHFLNNSFGSYQLRYEYMFHSSFAAGLKSGAIVLGTASVLFMVPSQLSTDMLKCIAVSTVIVLVHVYGFAPPVFMAFLSKTKWRKMLTEACGGSCACCGMEEDSSSIYFIPTGAKTVHAMNPHMQQRNNVFALPVRYPVVSDPPPPPLGMHMSQAQDMYSRRTPDVLKSAMHGTGSLRYPPRASSPLHCESYPYAATLDRMQATQHRSRPSAISDVSDGTDNADVEDVNRKMRRSTSSPATGRRRRKRSSRRAGHGRSESRTDQREGRRSQSIGSASSSSETESVYIVDESGNNYYKQQRNENERTLPRNSHSKKCASLARTSDRQRQHDKRRAAKMPVPYAHGSLPSAARTMYEDFRNFPAGVCNTGAAYPVMYGTSGRAPPRCMNGYNSGPMLPMPVASYVPRPQRFLVHEMGFHSLRNGALPYHAGGGGVGPQTPWRLY